MITDQMHLPLQDDSSILDTPSHVFGAAEDDLDRDLAITLAKAAHGTNDAEVRKRPQLSEGEVLGGLALLSMFGTERLTTARIRLAHKHRHELQKPADV